MACDKSVKGAAAPVSWWPLGWCRVRQQKVLVSPGGCRTALVWLRWYTALLAGWLIRVMQGGMSARHWSGSMLQEMHDEHQPSPAC